MAFPNAATGIHRPVTDTRSWLRNQAVIALAAWHHASTAIASTSAARRHCAADTFKCVTARTVRAALDGSLARARFRREPFFGLLIPEAIPGIPPEVLDPRKGWAQPAAYDRTAAELVSRFEANFAQFEAAVGEDVRAAAIRAAA